MPKQTRPPSPSIRRSVRISGRSTSVMLEDVFWSALKEIAATKGITDRDLVSVIHSERQYGNLSSAIRVFVLNYYRGQVRGANVSRNDKKPS
jgi:predicted DNA-binding ribbon-helix-helix protein